MHILQYNQNNTSYVKIQVNRCVTIQYSQLMTHLHVIYNTYNLQISAKLANDVFLVPTRKTWGGRITNFFFSPAIMSGFFSRMMSKTRVSNWEKIIVDILILEWCWKFKSATENRPLVMIFAWCRKLKSETDKTDHYCYFD